MRVSDLDAVETQQEVVARTERIRRLGGDRFETRHRRKDGSLMDVEASVSYLADQGGTIVCFMRDITERKHAEEVLRESEERFRTMANGAPIILWVTDTRGENQFVNRTYLEYFGVEFDAVHGAKWQSFIHPEDVRAHVDLVLGAAREEKAFDSEVRVRRKDGEWRWTENHGRPSFSTSGEFLGHVGITLDIGERKRAERALRDSEERLRVVVQAVGEGIVMRRRDGVIAVLNPAAERLTGLTASQMQGLSPYPPGWYTVREDGTLLPPEERPNRVALRTGKSSSNVIMGHHMPGGEVIWLSVNTTPVFEPGQRCALRGGGDLRGCHRAAKAGGGSPPAGGAAAAVTEAGERRSARGWHRSRLQQPAHRGLELCGVAEGRRRRGIAGPA